MLDEPPYPESKDAAVTRLCLADGKVVACINPPALESLLCDFWHLAAKSIRGDELSLHNVGELPTVVGCSPLSYCEITMDGEGPVMGRLHNPVAGFRQWEAQVYLTVNRLQAERGYLSLQRLGGFEAGGRVGQVELFGRLIFRLVGI